MAAEGATRRTTINPMAIGRIEDPQVAVRCKGITITAMGTCRAATGAERSPSTSSGIPSSSQIICSSHRVIRMVGEEEEVEREEEGVEMEVEVEAGEDAAVVVDATTRGTAKINRRVPLAVTCCTTTTWVTLPRIHQLLLLRPLLRRLHLRIGRRACHLSSPLITP